jgi:hypothetical protein
MNIKKIALIVFSMAVILSLMVSVASAAAPIATSVSCCWIGQNINDHSGQCPLNTQVYIYWNGVTPPSGAVSVTIITPGGTVLATYLNEAPSASGTITFMANAAGTYYVFLNGYPTYHVVTTMVASGSLFVLPESVLGTLMAIVSCAGAVVVFGVVKTKRANKAVKA